MTFKSENLVTIKRMWPLGYLPIISIERRNKNKENMVKANATIGRLVDKKNHISSLKYLKMSN